jgi:uroporphyrinogen-III synthase
MTLAADEFIGRFLLHALPDGFMRIRHYRLFANGQRTASLARARGLLAAAPPPAPPPHNARELLRALTGHDLAVCPCCGGPLVRIAVLSQSHPPPPFSCDSS